MRLTFIEVTGFTRIVEEHFGSDEEYRRFQDALLQDPGRGDVIQGTGGLRKVRWNKLGRGKGRAVD